MTENYEPYSNEINFLKEESNRILAKIKKKTEKRQKNEKNKRLLAELIDKFLRIWSTIDAYHNFANQRKPMTDDNTNEFLLLVRQYYLQRYDKLKGT